MQVNNILFIICTLVPLSVIYFSYKKRILFSFSFLLKWNLIKSNWRMVVIYFNLLFYYHHLFFFGRYKVEFLLYRSYNSTA